jgi:hypothetical protein
MSALRERMIEDMQLRGLAPRTQAERGQSLLSPSLVLCLSRPRTFAAIPLISTSPNDGLTTSVRPTWDSNLFGVASSGCVYEDDHGGGVRMQEKKSEEK